MRARTQRRAAKEAPATPAVPSRLELLGRGPWGFVPASIAVMIPCLWQSRVQAGDLSSHIYNVWLAQLIRQGRAPGLQIAPQTTNVLFDLILSGLSGLFGTDAAQRIAVMAAVLIFVWGAFAFISAVAGRRAWNMLPVVAVLAYGWVFHMGLFNFYLSLGLCFWALSLAWQYRPPGIAAAVALLALAYTAHGLPPAWTVALLAWRLIVERVPLHGRPYLYAGVVLGMAVLHVWLSRIIQTRWSISQVVMITGADQANVYDSKYLLICAGVLLLWAATLAKSPEIFSGMPFQLCAITAAGILILPTWALFPQYHHPLVYIAERMSLALGVCFCAAVAGAPGPRWHLYATGAVVALFFVFLYADERALNTLEDKIAESASHLPPGSRVVTTIQAPQLRTNPIAHMIDRVCIGRCYSYANYEPATGQFRIRATGPSPVVTSDDMDSSRMQIGAYVVKPRDLPLFRIALDDAGRAVLQSMPAGGLLGATYWNGI